MLSLFGRRYSPELLEDEVNLRLLKMLVSGECVSVNISTLSRSLRKHRNTVKKEVLWLLENRVVNRPVCPFMGLYKEYPLLVIVRADLPDEGVDAKTVGRGVERFLSFFLAISERRR